MTISDYQNIILKARRNQVGITKDMVAKLQAALENAYNNIERLLSGVNSDSRMTAQRVIWKARKEQLKSIAEDLKNGYADMLREGMTLSSVSASEISQIAESGIIGDLNIDKAYFSQYGRIPLKAVDNVWKRIG